MAGVDEPIEDARGLLCPLPVIRLQARVEGLAAGRIVSLLADDPAAADDVRLWAKGQGHEVVEVRSEGSFYRIRVRRRR
jgi:tRNA 2-thiouridine synthesizing protein A